MTGVLGHFVAALVPAALAACVYMNALEGSLVCAPTAAGQRASDLANSFQSVALIATTTARRCGTIPTCGEIRRWAKFGYTTTGAVISRTIRVTNRTSPGFARTSRRRESMPLGSSGGSSAGRYRPLAVLSLRANFARHGLDPFGYHLSVRRTRSHSRATACGTARRPLAPPLV
jgi:hypothetical protein